MTTRIRDTFCAALATVMPMLLCNAGAQGATLGFEPDDPNDHFVFDRLGAYQPNPYDAPADGADNLAQQTASGWVGLKSGESPSASLLWDGGLEGGNNSLLNLLLPDTFDLNRFMIVGVYGSQTVTVRGLDDGRLLYSRDLAIDLTPRLFVADWLGIDQLQILSGTDFVADPLHVSGGVRRNWAIDDLVYGEAAAVPLPGTGLLFASGLMPPVAGMWRRSRRARPHTNIPC